jgi:hypothetical protein
MSYFNRFPLVDYDGVLQVNLTIRTSIVESMKSDPANYIDYTIQDGETPEQIADRLYDDVELSWIILNMNDIVNMFEEWPMSYSGLESYINEKYIDPTDIHHYESISTGYIVNVSWPSYDRIPITNEEYEISINDEKRYIKLLLPELVGTVIDRHNQLMREV